MPEPRLVRLDEVATEVTVGFVGSMASEYQDTGVPFLRSQNVRPFRIDMSSTKYISESFHHKLSKSALQPDDVVTVRTGKPGTTAVIPKGAAEMNCADLVITRPGPDLDPHWLSYYINSAASGFISSHLVGAVQQHFNVGSAKAMLIPLPSLTNQQAVANILKTCDDKIAINRKISSLVQELAKLKFTHLRAGSIKLETPFDQVSKIGGGGTPQTSVENYWDGNLAWATPSDVTSLDGPYLATTTRAISSLGLAACSSPRYPTGSILMTSRATIGAFAIAEAPMAVNQGFIVVQPHDERLKWWIFHEMQSRVGEFISHANGATFLELSRGRFKQLPVRLADEATMHQFNNEAAALHDVARAALRENVTLAALRDTLLPELMSGRMRVREAKEQVGEVL